MVGSYTDSLLNENNHLEQPEPLNEKIKRYVRSRIVNSGPHSLGLKNILSFDCRNYLETGMCRSEPVGLTRTNDSTLYCAIDDVYLSKTLPENCKA